MSDPTSDVLGQAGVQLVGLAVAADLGWLFRDQPVLDFGIDAHVEIKIAGKATGRLIALQIKTGDSWFTEPNDAGWWYRFDERHAEYWLHHALPVVVVLVDMSSRTGYWQFVTSETVIETGKGCKISVPRDQVVSTATIPWEGAASGVALRASERYHDNLQVLPPACAPGLSQLHAFAPRAAEMLALFLAEGRQNPLLTVKSLLAATPSWMLDAPASGWQVAGSFASEHGEYEVAALAMTKAADLDSDRSGALRAVAGLQLLDADSENSRLLLEQAILEPGGDLLGRLGIAILDHGFGDAHPLMLPDELDLTSEIAAREPAIQAFLGLQADRTDDLGEAIRRYSTALELRPQSSQYMLKLASAHGRRALSESRQPEDSERARRLASAALQQRLRWDGPTVEALFETLRTLILQGDFDEVIRHGAPPPFGEARVLDAQRPEILRLTLQAARLNDDRELVDELIASGCFMQSSSAKGSRRRRNGRLGVRSLRLLRAATMPS
jgi:hypothetical protein